MRRIALELGIILLLIAVFAQSYNGRRDVVASERSRCIISSKTQAFLVNHIRVDQAASEIISNSVGVPQAVRQVRERNVKEADFEVSIIDSHIDRSQWWLLKLPQDQEAVRYGINHHPPFECNKQIKSASPIQFFN